MNKEWVEEKEREYKKNLQQRKEKIYNGIVQSKLINNEDKEAFIKMLNDIEKHPWSMLDSKMKWYYLDKVLESIEEEEVLDKMVKQWEEYISALEIEEYQKLLQYPEFYSCKKYLDSDPIEFDGDIIITDPCYVIKHRDYSTSPQWSEFHLYKCVCDYPDYDKISQTSKMFSENEEKFDKAMRDWKSKHPDDWDVCEYGYNMAALGFNTFMTRDTLYGDWSCTTFNLDTQEKIGSFCADAGLVSVFLLDDILKYNPNFDYHKERDWTTTWIRDFKGTVQFIVVRTEGEYKETTKYHKKGEKWEDYSVEVVGHGINKKTGELINFVGKQTGF